MMEVGCGLLSQEKKRVKSWRCRCRKRQNMSVGAHFDQRDVLSTIIGLSVILVKREHTFLQRTCC